MVGARDAGLLAFDGRDVREVGEHAAGFALVLVLVNVGGVDDFGEVGDEAANLLPRGEFAVDHLLPVGQKPASGNMSGKSRKEKIANEPLGALGTLLVLGDGDE